MPGFYMIIGAVVTVGSFIIWGLSRKPILDDTPLSEDWRRNHTRESGKNGSEYGLSE